MLKLIIFFFLNFHILYSLLLKNLIRNYNLVNLYNMSLFEYSQTYLHRQNFSYLLQLHKSIRVYQHYKIYFFWDRYPRLLRILLNLYLIFLIEFLDLLIRPRIFFLILINFLFHVPNLLRLIQVITRYQTYGNKVHVRDHDINQLFIIILNAFQDLPLHQIQALSWDFTFLNFPLKLLLNEQFLNYVQILNGWLQGKLNKWHLIILFLSSFKNKEYQ